MIIISFFLINFILVSSYISSNNFNSIVSLIKNDNLTNKQRNKINLILYKSYENWAVSKAKIFKKKHYFKCNKISLSELSLYGKVGLYKSILKYNGKSDFNYFASLYIDFECKKALTDAYSLSILPKKIRKQSKKNMNQEEIIAYKKLLFIDSYSDVRHLYQKNQDLPNNCIENYYVYDKLNVIWRFIEELPPFEKRIMYLKYDYFFNDQKNNMIIADLMCCSRETIRKTILSNQKKIEEKFCVNIF
tara:strand:+ start:180 stop:920 length:741 start_codon:yes stop_codon:yes gene_type:complete